MNGKAENNQPEENNSGMGDALAEAEAAFAGPDAETGDPGSKGANVLNEAVAFVKRFAILPSEAEYDAMVLWAAHTWLHQALTVSPRLALHSEKQGSGKTRCLDLLALLCKDAKLVLDPTGPGMAAMIRSAPTLLIDETDTIFGARGSGGAKRQLRGILNSGYKAGAVLPRLSKGEVVEDPVYGPVAFAGLGRLPETLASRSVIIRLIKRKRGQHMEQYFPRLHEPEGMQLGHALGRWAKTVALDVATAWPELPDGVEDRPSELWWPLLAIADAAGGDWPERGRSACRAIVLGDGDEEVLSPAEQLLADIARVWKRDGDHGDGAPAGSMTTKDLVTALLALPDAPWPGMWPADKAPLEIAALLRGMEITPVKVWDSANQRSLQGYKREAVRVPLAPPKPEVPSEELPAMAGA